MRASIFIILLITLCHAGIAGESVERSICGRLREPIMFRLWRSAARAMDPGVPPRHGAAYTFQTADARVLHGYRLAAESAVRGAVVFIQGNAMTVATIADDLLPLTAAGYDVYVLDFRGYGDSEGTPRIAALLSDYRQITTHLRSSGYQHIFVYGCSMGGVIASNLLDLNVDGVVIDSAPATVQAFGCPAELDPIKHLPSACGKVLLIAGGSDRVVKPDQIKPLLEKGMGCGAVVVERAEWSHPFMGPESEVASRLKEAAIFFNKLVE